MINYIMVIQIGAPRSKAFLIKENKIILVDTSINITLDKLLSDISANNIDISEISLIIITHAHFDHYALLPEFKKLINVPIACHPLAKKHIENGTNSPIVMVNKIGKLLLKLFGLKQPEYKANFEVDILVENEMDLNDFGVNGKIISTPGHTDCSLSIITENREAIIGDFILDMPFTKKPNYSFIATDIEKRKESIKKLLDAKCTKFYSSHAKTYNREQISKLLK